MPRHMPLSARLRRFLAALGLNRRRRETTGLVAAIVSFDHDGAGASQIAQADEADILTRLTIAVECADGGQFDGVDRMTSRTLWFFFGCDVRTLEAALLTALRAEPRCKGARLRLTSHGIAGPWSEIEV